jgi:hypothetical protein
MYRWLAIGTVCFALMAVGVIAQTPQPYAGMETRPIKALSEQQIADLRTGRGMSLALAAELNGYPGPRHVLELADQLNLSPLQLQNVKRLFDEMTAEAVALGRKLIAQETELDGQFVKRTVISGQSEFGNSDHWSGPSRTPQDSPKIPSPDDRITYTAAIARILSTAPLYREQSKPPTSPWKLTAHARLPRHGLVQD